MRFLTKPGKRRLMKQQSTMLSRRASLATIAFGAVATSTANARDEQLIEAHPQSCAEALSRLIEGNRRFVSGQLRHPHIIEEWRKGLAQGQNPFATILGCSDSRVPPELLFDQGFGDLFVVRVAGNVVDIDVTGSIEYGVDHLNTRLVVVMGHEGCGAVTAALSAIDDLSKEPNEIQQLVARIKPSVVGARSGLSVPERLQQSVEANVRASVRLLRAVPDLAAAEKEERTRIIGCVYDIASGAVRTLDF